MPADKVPGTHAIRMKTDKLCKNSIRYRSIETDSPIETVYVDKKAFPEGMPAEILVTVGPNLEKTAK